MDGVFSKDSLLRGQLEVHVAPAATELPAEGETSPALLNVFILAMASVSQLVAKNRETTTINAKAWLYQTGRISQSQGKSHEAEPCNLKSLVTARPVGLSG